MRITCRELAELADAYVDGDVPLMNTLKIGAHLVICRDCRAHVDQVRQTKRLVAVAVPRAIAAEARVLSLITAGARQASLPEPNSPSDRARGDSS